MKAILVGKPIMMSVKNGLQNVCDFLSEDIGNKWD
jgi:hypothetical protein